MIPWNALPRAAAATGRALFPFAVLLLIWQILVSAQAVPVTFLPAPSRVGEALWGLITSGKLLDDALASLSRLAIGMLVSGGMGVTLGILMGLQRGLADAIQPLVNFMNALAGITWIPLAILWFGLGTNTVTFVIWNAVFFVVLLNTIAGVRSVPIGYEQMLRTMGGRWYHIVGGVLVPGALPSILTGLRLGMGFGMRGLILAEMLAARNGLGYLIFNASYYYQSDVIVAGLITIGVLWLALDRLVFVPIEAWTVVRWGTVSQPS